MILHLLDTLLLQQSDTNTGHILLKSTLLIGHTQHPSYMCISSWPFVAKKLWSSNRQDMVLTRPPGISEGAFKHTCIPVQDFLLVRMWDLIYKCAIRPERALFSVHFLSAST